VDGVAADKVIGAKHVLCEKVLWSVGEGLGRMHSVPCPPGDGLRSILDGGGCDLRKHISDAYGDSVSSCAAIAGHDFLPFYYAQREKLRAGLATDGLPQGPLHGDPFLDNVLVDASTGELRGAWYSPSAAWGPHVQSMYSNEPGGGYVEELRTSP
jgi:hypothetical protein